MANALIVLAPGAEEIEAVTVPDVLVRAGVQVTIASAGDTTLVRGSRGIPLGAHTMLDLVRHQTFDLIYLPGGMGSATTCRDDVRIQDLAAAQLAAGRLLAVICAAPIALVPRELCRGRTLTSYPGVRAQVEPHAGRWLDQPVVVDGSLVTSQGAGTALALALTLVKVLVDSGTAATVANEIIATPLA